jgi:hypothetical protein
MTRVLRPLGKEKLILPFVDLKTEYYDLGIEERDRTDDQVTVDAAKAIMKYGVGVKNATVPPNQDRVTGYKLKNQWKFAERHDSDHAGRHGLPQTDYGQQYLTGGAQLGETDHGRSPCLWRCL